MVAGEMKSRKGKLDLIGVGERRGRVGWSCDAFAWREIGSWLMRRQARTGKQHCQVTSGFVRSRSRKTEEENGSGPVLDRVSFFGFFLSIFSFSFFFHLTFFAFLLFSSRFFLHLLFF